MCGRLTFHAKMNVLMREFAAELQGELAQREAELIPRYNIAPSQDVYVVRRSADGKQDVGYLLAPYADEMTVRPVSQYVNNARNEGPECIAEAAP